MEDTADDRRQHVLRVATEAFERLKSGFAGGEWEPFFDMLSDDFSFWFPRGRYLGLNRGKQRAVEFFSSASRAYREGLDVTEVLCVTANETSAVFEFRDEAVLPRGLYRNRVAISLDVRGDKICGYRQYFGSDGKKN